MLCFGRKSAHFIDVSWMKTLRKILSLVIVAVMAFSCCSVAFAGEDEGYPMVYLAGFGDTNIYYEDDHEQKSLFFPLDTDRLLGNLGNMGDYIKKAIRTREPDLLYTCIYSYVWDSFGMLRLNPDGSCVDGLVFIEVSSFGATCADYGKTFADDYKQAKYPETNLISPDRQIDASTCLFPFNTWFIKGLDHAQQNEDYHKVLAAIAYGDLDVGTDEEYPQYLMVSPEDEERIVPFYFYEEEETLYDKLWNIFRTMVLLPKTIFSRIFGR